MLNIPFDKSVVTGLKPQATGETPKAAYLNMGNALRAFVVVTLSQNTGAATKITLKQATDLAGTNEKDFTKAVPIWVNDDISASDIMTQAPDGVACEVLDTATGKKVIFQIDGEDLDVNGGFSTISTEITGGHVDNFGAIEYVCQGRFPGQEFTK